MKQALQMARIERSLNGMIFHLSEAHRDAALRILTKELSGAAVTVRGEATKHVSPAAIPYWEELSVEMLFRLLQYGSLSVEHFYQEVLARNEHYDRANFDYAVAKLQRMIGAR